MTWTRHVNGAGATPTFGRRRRRRRGGGGAQLYSEGHSAGKIARSAGLVVTPALWVRLWWATSCSRCPERWCASLCAAATPEPSSVQRWDWSATQDRRILSESPWRRSIYDCTGHDNLLYFYVTVIRTVLEYACLLSGLGPAKVMHGYGNV